MSEMKMPSFLSFQGRTYSLSADESADLGAYISKKFGLSSSDYFFISKLPFVRISLRLRGGKGGFGRAMIQDGERRSKRLPKYKDSCRTLSGHRVGYLKAKRNVVELRKKIKEMEAKRAEAKAILQRTNKQKELDNIEKKEMEIGESISKAVSTGFINNQAKDVNRSEISKPILNESDFSLLLES